MDFTMDFQDLQEKLQKVYFTVPLCLTSIFERVWGEAGQAD